MLHYITFGAPDLPPLIVAHGLYGQARNWGTIARGLADMRHVICVDMRNHGDSPWHGSHRYADMADDLAQVLSQVTDRPADVLGHSMGGKAAMALALGHPGLLRRLVVADIAPVAYDHGQLAIVQALQSLDLGAITRRPEAAAALTRDHGIDQGTAGFLTQNLDLGAKTWKMNLAVLAAEMPHILGFPAMETVFDGPALFLAGANSDYMRPAHRPAIKALFPQARLAKIPGAGHWLHAERPQEVTAALRAFLGA